MTQPTEADPDRRYSNGPQYPEEKRHPPPSYSAYSSSPIPKRPSVTAGIRGILEDPLTTLPPKVFVRIIEILDPVSRHCLYLTSRLLRQIGIGRRKRHSVLENEELTRCGKWLVMALLEQDLLDRLLSKSTSDRRKSFSMPFMKTSSRLPKNISKLTCSLCKTKHGPDSFLKGAPRTMGIHPKTERELLLQKSLQRICTWHFGKLVCIVNHRPTAASVFYGRWISTNKEMCMHCGQIEEYGGCNCRVPTMVNGKTMPPACEICPRVKMRVFERTKKEGDQVDMSWFFKADKDGTVYVLEDRTELGRSAKVSYHMPIEYR